ncbi:MAG: hypothetical protein KKA07_15750 [Bacteroidetes bacterium]|nr:hypothetical protein [Bacteroidota bacterium]MBU1720518.1 hypothetical protein [Bacteroidota bacterium]
MKTLAVAVYCAMLVFGLTDRPFLQCAHSKNKTSIAAFAIRDNVIPFQKMGTMLFTKLNLEKKYDHSCYVTSFSDDNSRQIYDSLLILTQNYDQVDVFLLAHGNYYVNTVSNLPEDCRQKIRMVYNSGCNSFRQADEWLNLGADSYVAHPGAHSASPVFYVYFLRRWLAGYTVEEAVNSANLRMQGFFDPMGRGFEPTAIASESIAKPSGNDNITINDNPDEN